MSTLRTEQLVAARKERYAELNAWALKSPLAKIQEFAIKALSAQEPQEMFSKQSILAQPAVEKVQSC